MMSTKASKGCSKVLRTVDVPMKGLRRVPKYGMSRKHNSINQYGYAMTQANSAMSSAVRSGASLCRSRVGCHSHGRKPEIKPRSAGWVRLDLYSAAMNLDDRLADHMPSTFAKVWRNLIPKGLEGFQNICQCSVVVMRGARDELCFHRSARILRTGWPKFAFSMDRVATTSPPVGNDNHRLQEGFARTLARNRMGRPRP